MKRYPGTFSDAMIRAILAGKKTQDRRVIKPQPQKNDAPARPYNTPEGKWAWVLETGMGVSGTFTSPFGRPGDRFWVPECFEIGHESGHGNAYTLLRPSGASECDGKVFYRADDAVPSPPTWRTSSHMPRWASRIVVEVTGVRVERVQEISTGDITAEGVDNGKSNPTMGRRHDAMQRRALQDLWDLLNAKRGFGWNENPWVWVPTFTMARRIRR